MGTQKVYIYINVDILRTTEFLQTGVYNLYIVIFFTLFIYLFLIPKLLKAG